MISQEQLENLDKIFDKNWKIKSDDDLLDLAELCDDESTYSEVEAFDKEQETHNEE